MKRLLLAYSLSAWGAAYAQFTPPPDNPTETANKKVLTQWGSLLEQGEVQQAFTLYISPDFVEHSDSVALWAKNSHPGAKEVESMLLHDANLTKPNPLHIAQVLVANGDLVTQFGRLGVDVFEIKDGKITAHWDAEPSEKLVKLDFAASPNR